MNRAERTNEIMGSMKTFTKQEYQKAEILPELLELQKELVNLTFNEEHAERGSLRIWDVEKHLEQLNEERGHVADAELQAFEEKCKFVCNLIKSEFSGRTGEEKTFRALDVIYGNKRIIKNCELQNDVEKTELDATVVTPKGIFIVEVKNTGKDVTIDQNGDFYRSGLYMNWDSNIGEKMNVKQKLLREALINAGFEKAIKVKSIVVFTNSRIEVNNRYEYVQTCFLSALPHIINNYKGAELYTSEDMDQIEKALEQARCNEAYPMEMDMEQFKQDFATVMAILETASEQPVEDEKKTVCKKDVEVVSKATKKQQNAKVWKIAGGTAALALVATTTYMVARHILKNK